MVVLRVRRWLLLQVLVRNLSRTGFDPHQLGYRVVGFVDDDPRADLLAQQQLEAAARSVGLREIHFQYEPIAAAFDYESHLTEEGLVLVADITPVALPFTRIGAPQNDFAGPCGTRGTPSRSIARSMSERINNGCPVRSMYSVKPLSDLR